MTCPYLNILGTTTVSNSELLITWTFLSKVFHSSPSVFVFIDCNVALLCFQVSTKQLCPPTLESGSTDATDSCITHTAAVGTTDTLHYLYISRGTPSFLAARTSVPSSIEVDWNAFRLANDSAAKSINFSSLPDEVVVVMFPQVSNIYSDINY